MCTVSESRQAFHLVSQNRTCSGRCRGCPLAARRPTVGIVLGGGGAKAAAHLGVFKVFEQAGVHIDMVSASSAGALVGLFYCAGYSAEEMAQIMATQLVPQGWRRWIPGSQWWQLMRLLRGGGLSRLIQRYIPAKDLEKLRTPLAVSATDLERGQTIILDRGPIETALLATMCLPGLGKPVRSDGRWLIDGSVLCDLPVQPLSARNVDVKVGVNLVSVDNSAVRDAASTSSRWKSWQVVSQSIAAQLQQLSSAAINELDLVIRPDFGSLGLTDFRHMPAMITAGQKAAHHNMGKLLQSMQACPKRTVRD